MRLRNKKTGVVGEVGYISTSTGDILVSNIHDQEEWYHYKSLAELNEEWEDVSEAYKEKAGQANARAAQANDELLKNAIAITKRAHKIWDKVEKYRCKLVYGYDLGVDVLNVDDIEEINIALQEYSGGLIEAMFNLTGKYIPHVSDYESDTESQKEKERR